MTSLPLLRRSNSEAEEANMIEIRVVGVAPWAEQHEAVARLHSIPRKGDTLMVWDGRQEVFVDVDMVAWPAWEDGGAEPTIYLRRDEGLSDDEWADVFAAIKERRAP